MADQDNDKGSGADSLKDILDELFEKLKTDGRDSLATFLELEEDLVHQYRHQLGSLRETHDRMQREFATLVLKAFRGVTEMQTQYRQTVGKTHDTLLVAHEELVKHLRESLTKPKPKPKPPAGGARSRTGAGTPTRS